MKFYNPVLLFLDEDLKLSAQSFSNEYLDLMIKRSAQILFCGLFYFTGVRSKKHYQFYFSKERKKDSIKKWYPNYPLKKFPSFTFYNSVESKWVRKCGDHFQYLVDYFKELVDEYSYRHNRDHDLYELRDFFGTILINLMLSNGINVPCVNLKKIVIPWKNLAPQFRKKDLIEGYRKYYRYLIPNPWVDYADVKRDIPAWLLQGKDISQYSFEQ